MIENGEFKNVCAVINYVRKRKHLISAYSNSLK